MHTVQEIDNGIGIIPFHAVNWKKTKQLYSSYKIIQTYLLQMCFFLPMCACTHTHSQLKYVGT